MAAQNSDGMDPREQIDPAERASDVAREWRTIADTLRAGLASQVESVAHLASPDAVLDFTRAIGLAMQIDHAILTFERDAERELNRPTYE